jgi:hypothetical protein
MVGDDAFRVLDRVTAIFEVLGREDGIRISELAARTGLAKSTVSRLVSGLVRQRYLERDGTAVRLGLRLFELGQIAETPRALRRIAMPVMSQLSRATGGAVELAVRDGDAVVCVAVARGSSPHVTVAPVGSRAVEGPSIFGRALESRTTVVERRDAPPSTTLRVAPAVAIATALHPSPTGVDAAMSLVGVAGEVDVERWAALLGEARDEIARRELSRRDDDASAAPSV